MRLFLCGAGLCGSYVQTLFLWCERLSGSVCVNGFVSVSARRGEKAENLPVH